ncbi:MAG: AAA family ATPase, partial [Proteobacteria bacterium]|nr:AAA family ATPase [Pseudomonadota bacterium]
LEEALGNLCKWIYKATKRQTVILLDEYDVPLQKAAIHDIHHPGDNFFDKMVSLVGNFISSGFKSNDYLAYGIIAGCMRVAKESIFTGMNNPGVITVVDEIPNEYWGFTHEEVADMLAYYGISDKMDALKYWYDGYLYSGREVFNPWSLLNAIRGLVYGQGDKAIQSYWAMTSSNDIIDEMIDNNPEYRNELARLMRGETKWVPVYKDLLYRDLKLRPDAIWSFLLYTGYLKPIEIKKDEDDLLIAKVAVPNEEILTVMKSAMQHWWKDIKLLNFNSQTLLRALITGDVSNAEREIRIVLNDSTSVFDYNEAFYHGMLMGLLGNVAIVRSNDEYGEGRPDIVALAEETGVIIEVKCVTPKMLQQVKKSCPSMDEDDLVDELCEIQLDEARQQIVNRKYARAVLRHEPIARTVVAYAVCFCKKWCVMQKVDVE